MKVELGLAVAVWGAILLASCELSNVREDGTLRLKPRIVTIEGCEYWVVENHAPNTREYSLSMTHKGNCSNPIHQYRQEQP